MLPPAFVRVAVWVLHGYLLFPDTFHTCHGIGCKEHSLCPSVDDFRRNHHVRLQRSSWDC
eukprot:13484157-Heterocapsa_arctica.AAC.1